MDRMVLRSPAKLNLFLQVVNRRPDGYHNLRTLFERIDLWDELAFRPNRSGRIRISCDHPQVPVGPKNLAYRAAKRLQDYYQIPHGVDIRIVKRIPVAAGLGGGSSNGATALLGLNRMWQLGLDRKALMAHGRALGSDVPFFLRDCSWAMGTDRGDRIRELTLPGPLWHVLVCPRLKMYSREVFTRLNLQLTKPGDNVNILIRSLKNRDICKAGQWLSNDLESSILQIRPQLFRVIERFRSLGLKGVAFSGSGPSVFGLCRSRQEAEQKKVILSKHYNQVFAVRTL